MMDDKDIGEMARANWEAPETPRDRMWERIDAARSGRRGVARPAPTTRRRVGLLRSRSAWGWAAGLAAVLAVGVLIGREMLGQAPEPVVVTVPAREIQGPGLFDAAEVRRDVYRLAAGDLFGRADFLLTDFKARSCETPERAVVPEWAGGMLVRTRLLMGTPAAEDPEIRAMLEDLEMVLAQIAGLSPENCARDAAWIRSGLENRSTLDRLRRLSGPGGSI